MSKGIVTGDWHVGIRGNSDLYLDIFKTWVKDFLYPVIHVNDAEHLFIIGDFFDNRNSLDIRTMNIAINVINDMMGEFPKLKMYLIVGNHDMYYTNRRDVNSLRIFNHERIYVIESIMPIKIDERSIIMSPYLVDKNDLDKLFSRKADYCLGHFDIDGFEMMRGIVSKGKNDPKRFRDYFGRTYSGHFHLRNEDDRICYVGNPYQCDWGDYQNEKGVYVIDFEKKRETFVPNNVSPKYMKVYLSQLKKGTVTLDGIDSSFVQLVVDEDCTDATLDKLKTIITDKAPLSLSISDNYEKPEDSQGGDEPEAEISGPIEHLQAYVKKTKFPDDIDTDYLQKILTESYKRALQ